MLNIWQELFSDELVRGHIVNMLLRTRTRPCVQQALTHPGRVYCYVIERESSNLKQVIQSIRSVVRIKLGFQHPHILPYLEHLTVVEDLLPISSFTLCSYSYQRRYSKTCCLSLLLHNQRRNSVNHSLS